MRPDLNNFEISVEETQTKFRPYFYYFCNVSKENITSDSWDSTRQWNPNLKIKPITDLTRIRLC